MEPPRCTARECAKGRLDPGHRPEAGAAIVCPVRSWAWLSYEVVLGEERPGAMPERAARRPWRVVDPWHAVRKVRVISAGVVSPAKGLPA